MAQQMIQNLLEKNKNLFTTLINNNKNSGKGYSVEKDLRLPKEII